MFSTEIPFFCVDMGTTRTRVWLVERNRIWAHQAADFGARNVAAGESKAWLEERLGQLLDRTEMQAREYGLSQAPSFIMGAGMITSPQGILEIDHIEAPVDAVQLAQCLRVCRLAGRDDLPLILVPGIRTGELRPQVEKISDVDLMRGEETLCVGLLDDGLLQSDTALLTLGSHWKWIWIDEQTRIAGSRTSMAGEMIHAIQTHTLIAGSLSQGRPEAFDLSWVNLGFKEADKSGLTRALFCIRLLQLQNQGTSEQRLSFLYGAFIRSEIDHLRTRRPERIKHILIAGPSALAEIWQAYIAEFEVAAHILTEDKQESAYLNGLRCLLRLSQISQ
ncbi:MAG: hypothetical protein JWQ42_2974 [Edaphobacter sp.]|nr:hypothetical protein [Edaphobacter sp.]